MTSIEKLVESLENELESAWQLPLSGGKILIDAKDIKETIHQVKENLPMEIVQAKKIVQDRSEIIEKARSEAESMIKASEEKMKENLSKSEIVKAAQTKAEEILTDASAKAKNLRVSSDEYVNKIMKDLDESVSNSLSEIKKVRRMFQSGKSQDQ